MGHFARAYDISQVNDSKILLTKNASIFNGITTFRGINAVAQIINLISTGAVSLRQIFYLANYLRKMEDFLT